MLWETLSASLEFPTQMSSAPLHIYTCKVFSIVHVEHFFIPNHMQRGLTMTATNNSTRYNTTYSTHALNITMFRKANAKTCFFLHAVHQGYFNMSMETNLLYLLTYNSEFLLLICTTWCMSLSTDFCFRCNIQNHLQYDCYRSCIQAKLYYDMR